MVLEIGEQNFGYALVYKQKCRKVEGRNARNVGGEARKIFFFFLSQNRDFDGREDYKRKGNRLAELAS